MFLLLDILKNMRSSTNVAYAVTPSHVLPIYFSKKDFLRPCYLQLEAQLKLCPSILKTRTKFFETRGESCRCAFLPIHFRALKTSTERLMSSPVSPIQLTASLLDCFISTFRFFFPEED